MENPENSKSVEAMEALDMDLLMAVRDTGAKDVKDISWEKVLQALPGNALPGNQLAFLKSRLKTWRCPCPSPVRGGLCQQAELREEGGEQGIWGGGAST